MLRGDDRDLLALRASSALKKKEIVSERRKKKETYLKGAAEATPFIFEPFFKVLLGD
jgi:hypothetical protein